MKGFSAVSFVVFCAIQIAGVAYELGGARMQGILLIGMGVTGVVAIPVGFCLAKLKLSPTSPALDAGDHHSDVMGERLWNWTVFLQFLILIQVVIAALFLALSVLFMFHPGRTDEVPSEPASHVVLWVFEWIPVVWLLSSIGALLFVIGKRRRHQSNVNVHG